MGAKGGFVCKRLPAGTREEIQAEVIACYQTFIRGLLDLTDNIVAGRIVPPPRVVRRDGDDAYLVVAADKGTATFSDIANAISIEYGFWLGDAFASGGSAGYDHKKMAHHGARRLGMRQAPLPRDRHRHPEDRTSRSPASATCPATYSATACCCRGTSACWPHSITGTSSSTRSPDAATSFAERAAAVRPAALELGRLRPQEDLPRRRRISAHGQVHRALAAKRATCWASRPRRPRPTRSSAPSCACRWTCCGTAASAPTSKSSRRIATREVGDRTNDAVRINGAELRAKVVGEGGNLGLSQRGRVEYALAGGRLNTDFIDNSAGVNTSDVEVNIKILLNPLVQAGKLHPRRSQPAAGAHDATRWPRWCCATTTCRARPSALWSCRPRARLRRIPAPDPLAGALRRSRTARWNSCRLTRSWPSGARAALGLTRPELAILLAYSKIWLTNHLLASDVPEDPYLSNELERYFPAPVRERFARAIAQHRLRREIIATATTNSLVNRMGPDVRAARPGGYRRRARADRARLHRRARDLRHARPVGADRGARQQGAGANCSTRWRSRPAACCGT